MKVLIISHNPLSDQSNMGKTLCSLFSGFRPEELCQLYIYPTVPNSRHCGSYFRITDQDALRAVFSRKCPGGELRRIEAGQGMYESTAIARFYRNRKNQSPMRGLLRDAMWRRSGWHSAQLKDWLEREKPDVLFVAPGGAKFLYDFALEIGETLRIPIVTYLCDEYYFVKAPKGLLSGFRWRLLRRKMEALLAKTDHLVAISPDLRAAYVEKFRIPATVVMTGAAISVAEAPKVAEDPTEISYFGNIRCDRYISLADIGRELDAINAELGTQYQLKIYSAEQDKTILSALKKYRSVEICGFLLGDAFTQALHDAQLLLHVEGFGEKTAERVKHSVSTKIADSLASGIPLLAYGPGEIASMQHLRRNECALMAASKEELRTMLLTAFADGETRKLTVENALKTAGKFHSSHAASAMLRDIFEDCL